MSGPGTSSPTPVTRREVPGCAFFDTRCPDANNETRGFYGEEIA